MIGVAEDRHIILREPASSAVDLKPAGVGSRKRGIEGQANRLTELGGKNGGDDIALRPLAVGVGLIAIGMISDISVKSRRL